MCNYLFKVSIIVVAIITLPIHLFATTGTMISSENIAKITEECNAKGGDGSTADSTSGSTSDSSSLAKSSDADGDYRNWVPKNGTSDQQTANYLGLATMLGVGIVGVALIKSCTKLTPDTWLAGAGAAAYIYGEAKAYSEYEDEMDKLLTRTISAEDTETLQLDALKAQKEAYDDMQKISEDKQVMQIAAASAFGAAAVYSGVLTLKDKVLNVKCKTAANIVIKSCSSTPLCITLSKQFSAVAIEGAKNWIDAFLTMPSNSGSKKIDLSTGFVINNKMIGPCYNSAALNKTVDKSCESASQLMVKSCQTWAMGHRRDTNKCGGSLLSPVAGLFIDNNFVKDQKISGFDDLFSEDVITKLASNPIGEMVDNKLIGEIFETIDSNPFNSIPPVPANNLIFEKMAESLRVFVALGLDITVIPQAYAGDSYSNKFAMYGISGAGAILLMGILSSIEVSVDNMIVKPKGRTVVWAAMAGLSYWASDISGDIADMMEQNANDVQYIIDRMLKEGVGDSGSDLVVTPLSVGEAALNFEQKVTDKQWGTIHMKWKADDGVWYQAGKDHLPDASKYNGQKWHVRRDVSYVSDVNPGPLPTKGWIKTSCLKGSFVTPAAGTTVCYAVRGDDGRWTNFVPYTFPKDVIGKCSKEDAVNTTTDTKTSINTNASTDNTTDSSTLIFTTTGTDTSTSVLTH